MTDSEAYISDQAESLSEGAISHQRHNAFSPPDSAIFERRFYAMGLIVPKRRDNSLPARLLKTVKTKSGELLDNQPEVDNKDNLKERSKSYNDQVQPNQGFDDWFTTAMNDLRE